MRKIGEVPGLSRDEGDGLIHKKRDLEKVLLHICRKVSDAPQPSFYAPSYKFLPGKEVTSSQVGTTLDLSSFVGLNI